MTQLTDRPASEMLGVSKPLIVEDAVEREIKPEEMVEDFRAMNYGAWRVLRELRESVMSAEEPMTAEGIILLIVTLEVTYRSLYRAAP